MNNTYKVVSLAVNLIIVWPSFATELYPSLADVKIGLPFEHPQANDFPDKERPTTQFKVPNYGDGSNLFPEYEVSILNSSHKVVIITAETVSRSISECRDKLAKAKSWIDERFIGYEPTDANNSVFNRFGEVYHKGDENIFYILDCRRSYGPFVTMHYQIRGMKEDSELQNAWEEFFNSRSN